MIGFLEGQIAAKAVPLVTINVGGVGYEVQTPMSTFLALPAVGEAAHFLTHLVVREDAHLLYGFASEAERQLFRALLNVNGVGPRIALSVLSAVSVEKFGQLVQEQNVAALTKIPGVGRKTAERLVVETRDSLEKAAATGRTSAEAAARDEAHAALAALGYKPAEVERLLKSAEKGKGPRTAEELLRRALAGAVGTP